LSPKFVLWQTTIEGEKIPKDFCSFLHQGKTNRATHELLVALLLDDWLPHCSYVFCLDCFHWGHSTTFVFCKKDFFKLRQPNINGIKRKMKAVRLVLIFDLLVLIC